MPAGEGPGESANFGSSLEWAVDPGIVRVDIFQFLPWRTGVVDRHHGPELHGRGADAEQPEALPAANLAQPQVPRLPHKTLEYNLSARLVPAD